MEINAVLKSAEEGSSATPSNKSLSQRHRSSKLERLAMQTIFAVIDHLNKWLRMRYMEMEAKARKNRADPTKTVTDKDVDYLAVEKFMASVSQKKLADASFHNQAYARSLMHLENHLRQKPGELQASLFSLEKVVSSLRFSLP